MIDDASLAREREVVKEERRFRTDNDIDGMMDEALGALVVRGPPVSLAGDRLDERHRGHHPRGLRAHTSAPTTRRTTARWCWSATSTPKNALREIERLYGPIPAGEALPKVATGEPPQKGERRAVIRYPSQAPAVLAGFRAPAGHDPDSLVLDLIETALSSGEGARLKRALVYEQELCVDAHVSFGWRMDPGLFEMSLKFNPGVDPARAESARGPSSRASATEPLSVRS